MIDIAIEAKKDKERDSERERERGKRLNYLGFGGEKLEYCD